jgi:hypothetical protein
MRIQFQSDLTRHLTGVITFTSTRMTLKLSDLHWKTMVSETSKQRFKTTKLMKVNGVYTGQSDQLRNISMKVFQDTRR